MRHRISQKTYFHKVILLIIGLFLIAINVSSIGTEYFFPNLHLLLIGIACVWISIYLFKNPLFVEFDDKYFYVSRGNKTQEIPLSNVVTIKMTMTEINTAHLWKVRFIDSEGKRRVVRFLPYRSVFKDFNEFKIRVQSANPEVTVQNWSHSFDFDQ